MLWDKGTWEPERRPARDAQEGRPQVHPPRQAAQGQLGARPHEGPRHQAPQRQPRENWLLIKHRDDYAKTDVDVTEKFTTSVETGRDLDGIAKGLKSKKKTAKALEVPRANVWTRSGAVALPKFRPPQLATLVDDVPDGDNWVFETEVRRLPRRSPRSPATEVRIYTRTGKDWTDTSSHRLRRAAVARSPRARR